LGLITGTLRLLGFPREANDQPLQRFAMSMLCLAALALVVSWGPYVENQKAPFFFMIKVAPFLKNTRAIGRYGMFAALPLGVMLVVALRCLYKAPQQGDGLASVRSLVVGGVALILLGIESLPTGKVFQYQEPLRGRYENLSTIIQPGTPIVELPSNNSDHFETIKRILEQMNGSLYHHGRLVVGYSGRTSPESATLIYLDQKLTEGSINIRELFANIRHLGVRTVLIHTDRYPAKVLARITEATSTDEMLQDFTFIRDGADIVVIFK
jgi:hypothetical protein